MTALKYSQQFASLPTGMIFVSTAEVSQSLVEAERAAYRGDGQVGVVPWLF